jgi:hypothetical protein
MPFAGVPLLHLLNLNPLARPGARGVSHGDQMKRLLVAAFLFMTTFAMNASFEMPVVLKKATLTPGRFRFQGRDLERKQDVFLSISVNEQDGLVTSFAFKAGKVTYKLPACVIAAIRYPKLSSITVNCGYNNEDHYHILIDVAPDANGSVSRQIFAIYVNGPSDAIYSITREYTDCTTKTDIHTCRG